MTHKFKFGDLVRCEYYQSIGVIIGVNEARKSAEIFFNGINITRHKRMSSLELIPHPDTVRLNWLLKNDCALTERLCDEDGDILDTPNAVIQKQEDHFEVLAATSNDIREAIDVAMAHIESKR